MISFANHYLEVSDKRYYRPIGGPLAPWWVNDWIEQQPWYRGLNSALMAAASLQHWLFAQAVQAYIDDNNISHIKIVGTALWADIEITPDVTLFILSLNNQKSYGT